MNGVVRDEPLPDEIPEGVNGFGRESATRGLVNRLEKRGAVRPEVADDRQLATRRPV